MGNEEKEPNRSWRSILREGRKHLQELAHESILDNALTRFILPKEELPPIEVDRFLSEFTLTATNTATLGFLIASGAAVTGDARGKFLGGVDRCLHQQAPINGPSVHTDPKLLIGLSAGIAALRDSSNRKLWLESRLLSLGAQNGLMKSVLGAYGLTLLGNSDGWRMLQEALLRAKLESPTDVATVLWALNLAPTGFTKEVRSQLDDTRRRALESFPLGQLQDGDAFGCAFTVRVAARLLEVSAWDLEQTALDRLLNILRRFPTAMAMEEESPRDEYDIQRILWAMLAGVYPDLRTEQWLEEFGVYQPRTDLAIESMKVVVEAKYIRKASDFRKVQDELVADAATYTRNPERIERVVAVVYDATSSQHKYEPMRMDLKSVSGVEEVIIIPHASPQQSKRRKKRNARSSEGSRLVASP